MLMYYVLTKKEQFSPQHINTSRNRPNKLLYVENDLISHFMVLFLMFGVMCERLTWFTFTQD